MRASQHDGVMPSDSTKHSGGSNVNKVERVQHLHWGPPACWPALVLLGRGVAVGGEASRGEDGVREEDRLHRQDIGW